MTEFPMKRGRKPLFTSREVDEIQRAEATLEQLAVRYRTSRSTIARIRSNAYEYGPVDSAEKARTHGDTRYRKPRTRTSRMDEDTLMQIACDMRPQRIVAAHWGVSVPYVAKLRAKYGTVNSPPPIVQEDIMRAILASSKSDEEVAKQFAIPEVIVRRIRHAEEDKTGV